MNWCAIRTLATRSLRRNVKSKRFIFFVLLPFIMPILGAIVVGAIIYFSSNEVVIICPAKLEPVAVQVKDALSQGDFKEQIGEFQPKITLISSEDEIPELESELRASIKSAKIVGYILVKEQDDTFKIEAYPSVSIRGDVKRLKERILTITPLLRSEGYVSKPRVKENRQEELARMKEEMSPERIKSTMAYLLIIICMTAISFSDGLIYSTISRERKCLEVLISAVTPKELCISLCTANIATFLILYFWYMLLICPILLVMKVASPAFIFSQILFGIAGMVLSSLSSCRDSLIYGNVKDKRNAIGIYMPIKFALLFGSVFSLSAPNSNFAIVLGIVPITSPLLAPFRLEFADNSSILECLLSFFILVLSSYLAFRFWIERLLPEKIIYPPPGKKKTDSGGEAPVEE